MQEKTANLIIAGLILMGTLAIGGVLVGMFHHVAIPDGLPMIGTGVIGGLSGALGFHPKEKAATMEVQTDADGIANVKGTS